MTITLQARKSSTAEWGTLNALSDMNKELQTGRITADDVKTEARRLMQQWQATIGGAYPEMELRVHDDSIIERAETITDDTWPRHPDGRRKKIGEMTHAQQVAVARGAVARLAPEFARQGVAVQFQGVWPGELSNSA